MNMIKIPFEVLGKKWMLRVLKRGKYKQKNGSDSCAITYFHKRRIDININHRDLETVVHELVHAYLYEMCTHSADINADALEEVFAELMAKRGYELLALAESLLSKITPPESL